ncbi:hypothetical protein K439DRAFT_1041574 [Ramaria rubella]|nr:hypothetical protein K439DRAFT_1041574 [Ramaria rubella]
MASKTYRLNDQEIRLTARQKREVEASTIIVRASYCEQSQSAVFGTDHRTSVEEAMIQAQQVLEDHLEQKFRGVPNIVIDPSCTDIFPAPRSLEDAIGTLEKPPTFTFWPKNREELNARLSSDDTPIASHLASVCAQALIAEVQTGAIPSPKTSQNLTHVSELEKLVVSLRAELAGISKEQQRTEARYEAKFAASEAKLAMLSDDH